MLAVGGALKPGDQLRARFAQFLNSKAVSSGGNATTIASILYD